MVGGVEHKCGRQSQGVSLFDLGEEQERNMLTSCKWESQFSTCLYQNTSTAENDRNLSILKCD